MSTDTTLEQNDGTPIPGEGEPQDHLAEHEGDQGQDGHDYEEQARMMGWTPQDHWRGDPDRWVDAETFVERAQTRPAIAAERLRKADAALAEERAAREMDQQIAQEQFKRLEGMSVVALKRQKEQIEKSYAARMRQATEDGDVDTYDRLAAEKGEAIKEMDDEVAEVAKPVEPPKPDPQAAIPPAWKGAVDTFVGANAWFGQDPALTESMKYMHTRLQNEKPGLSPEENLAASLEFVRSQHPDKFGLPGHTAGFPPSNGSGQRAAPAEGGSRVSEGGSPGKRARRKLKPEEREQGQRFVDEGLYKSLDEYALDLEKHYPEGAA